MALATRLHVRKRGHAAIAFVTSLVVLACSVLALHHESTVAHVVSANGDSLHAAETDCHERAGQRDVTAETHIHELPVHEEPDFGICTLTGLAHSVTTPTHPVLLASTSQIYVVASLLADAPSPSGSRLLQIAPKTSPPRA